jgi:hypothetical protein
MPEKFKTPESKVNMNTGNQTNFLGGNVVVTSQVMLEFLPVPSRRLVSLPFRTGLVVRKFKSRGSLRIPFPSDEKPFRKCGRCTFLILGQ